MPRLAFLDRKKDAAELSDLQPKCEKMMRRINAGGLALQDELIKILKEFDRPKSKIVDTPSQNTSLELSHSHYPSQDPAPLQDAPVSFLITDFLPPPTAHQERRDDFVDIIKVNKNFKELLLSIGAKESDLEIDIFEVANNGAGEDIVKSSDLSRYKWIGDLVLSRVSVGEDLNEKFHNILAYIERITENRSDDFWAAFDLEFVKNNAIESSNGAAQGFSDEFEDVNDFKELDNSQDETFEEVDDFFDDEEVLLLRQAIEAGINQESKPLSLEEIERIFTSTKTQKFTPKKPDFSQQEFPAPDSLLSPKAQEFIPPPARRK